MMLNWKTCSECGRNFLQLTEDGICGVCEGSRQEASAAHRFAQSILDDLDGWTDRVMVQMELSKRELRARIDKIPPALKRILPKATVKALMAGEFPGKGFGLGGNTGGGKTMALSALLREYIKSVARNYAKTPSARSVEFGSGGMTWCSWPDEVSHFRAHATADGTESRIDSIKRCGLLFLDDLGRERIRGSYSDDWAASQLDAIVNFRYRNELPVLWTTNIPEPKLVDLYGAALFSRMTADNPLVWVDGLTDLRGAA